MPYRASGPTLTVTLLRNEQMSQLFLAAAEAAEEAILNSLFKATTMKGKDGRTAQALPLEKIKGIMK
jgi:D-aminopeptidase